MVPLDEEKDEMPPLPHPEPPNPETPGNATLLY